MKSFLLITALTLTVFTAQPMNSLKQQSYLAIKDFFQLNNNQSLVLNGQHVSTPAEYGKTCRITIDFTQPGNEFIAISGEYTPFTKVGDGIFFNAAEDSFTDLSYQKDSLIIEQTINDSFSTWTKNTLEFHKKNQSLVVNFQQTNSFLFFTDHIKKQCIVVPEHK